MQGNWSVEFWLFVIFVLLALFRHGPVDERTRSGETGQVIGRQRSIGLGAIVDPDGYIITNAHVIAGARHIQVVPHRDTAATGPCAPW